MHPHQEQDQGRVRNEDNDIAFLSIQNDAMPLNALRLISINELFSACSISSGRGSCCLLSDTVLRGCLGCSDCQWCLKQPRPPPSDTSRVLWVRQSAA